MSRLFKRREPSIRTSPEVDWSVLDSDAVEQPAPPDFSDRRRLLEQSTGDRLERIFTKHADIVQDDDGAETLQLVKEVKLGEWTDVTVIRKTDDQGVRTTTFSTWMSMSGDYGWGSAMQYVQEPGDPATSDDPWQPGTLVACRMTRDKETGERTVVPVGDPEPNDHGRSLPDPRTNLNIICYGGALLDTLTKSVSDKSQGSITHALRARGIRYIDERKKTVQEEVIPIIARKHHEGVQRLGRAATHAADAIKHRLPGHWGEQD